MLVETNDGMSKRTPCREAATAIMIATRADADCTNVHQHLLRLQGPPSSVSETPDTLASTRSSLSASAPKPAPLPPKPPPMLKLAQPLHLPIILIQRLLAAINMIRTIIAGTIFPIVAAAGAIGVGIVYVGRGVCVRRGVCSQRVGARIGGVHVEGEVVCLGSGESDGVVDAEELV